MVWPDSISIVNAYNAGSPFGSQDTRTTVRGYLSQIGTADGKNNYNFYSSGLAPNFFKGDTYIGGESSRNTFELWESTLTEEQLEQYEAGTLAVPANVSTPGDGSFARAWYYDQQDAETQAQIDSGELEYPTHLAAATFTDTFDLGKNTTINLNSDGFGEFKRLLVGETPTSPFQKCEVRQGNFYVGKSGLYPWESTADERQSGVIITAEGTVEAYSLKGESASFFALNRVLEDGTNVNQFKVDQGGGAYFNGWVNFGRKGRDARAAIDCQGSAIFGNRDGVGTAINIYDTANAGNIEATNGEDLSDKKDFTICAYGGNVGVGITDPQALLHVNGLVESEGGVKVSGGSAAAVESGMRYGNNDLRLTINSSDRLYIGNKGHFGINRTPQDDTLFFIGGTPDSWASSSKGFRNSSTLADNVTAFSSYQSDVILSSSQNADYIIHYLAQDTDVSSGGTVERTVGFQAGSRLSTGTDQNIAFQSSLAIDGDKTFNFFADGSAPNYFRGDTYIGGNVSRNTFDLWKSTLTEEQKEQLAAGTLAIPANVSNPGDGSFVRQWWYDQQSAEDQALIDSGELQYPERYQPENFVDTFDLGDDTNINLLSNGLGEFGGGVRVTGGSQSTSNIHYNATQSRLRITPLGVNTGIALDDTTGNVVIGSGQAVAISDNSTLNISCFSDERTRGVFAFGTGGAGDLDKNIVGFQTQMKPETDGADIGNNFVAFDAIYGSSDWTNDADKIAGDVISFNAGPNHFAPCTGSPIAFKANNPRFASHPGKGSYNFYAAGSAPNYFAGYIHAVSNIYSSFNTENTGLDKDTQPEEFFNLTSGSGFFNCYCPGGGGNSASKYVGVLPIGDAGTRNAALFYQMDANGNNGRSVGYIAIKGNGGLRINCGVDGEVQTTSDYRLKTNIADMTSATTKIKQLRPVSFDFINGSTGVDGFIAHELQTVVPRAVSGVQDEEEAIGTLVDYDGTTLRTNVTQPESEDLTYEEQVEATPYVAAVEATYDEDGNELTPEVPEVEATYTTVTRTKTWTPTGTQPVYQGVDQTKAYSSAD